MMFSNVTPRVMLCIGIVSAVVGLFAVAIGVQLLNDLTAYSDNTALTSVLLILGQILTGFCLPFGAAMLAGALVLGKLESLHEQSPKSGVASWAQRHGGGSDDQSGP